MSIDIEAGSRLPEIYSLKTTWPKPLDRLQKLWYRFSGLEKTYLAGFTAGAQVMGKTVAERLSNDASPIIGYTELLSSLPSVMGDSTATIYVQEIADAGADIEVIINQAERFKKPVYETGRPFAENQFDLEKSAQE
jgi:hypothetical protein